MKTTIQIFKKWMAENPDKNPHDRSDTSVSGIRAICIKNLTNYKISIGRIYYVDPGLDYRTHIEHVYVNNRNIGWCKMPIDLFDDCFRIIQK
jgi:hypothetical protein